MAKKLNTPQVDVVALNRVNYEALLTEPKDSQTIHFDEDYVPHGACDDPIHCDCMCPHCWGEKVAIIRAVEAR